MSDTTFRPVVVAPAASRRAASAALRRLAAAFVAFGEAVDGFNLVEGAALLASLVFATLFLLAAGFGVAVF